MDITKKDLLLFPSQRCPNITNLRNLPFVTNPDKIKFLLTASIHKRAGRYILKATLFWKESRKPAYLLFCDKDQEQFWTYSVDGHRWSNACLHNLVGELHAPMLCIANTDKNEGASYFRQKNRLTSYCVLDFQLSVRENEGHNIPSGATYRYHTSRAFMDSIMEQAGPLPSDIHQFIDLHVLPESRYFYYRREKDHITGFCSHCRTESSMPLPKGEGTLYNKAGKCPHCQSGVWFKPQGRACQIKNDGRMEYVQRIADGFLIRSFYVFRIHAAEYHKKYEEYLDEDYRTFVSHSGKQYEFFYYQSHYGTNEWRYTNSYSSYYGYRPYCPGGALYTKNLNQIFNGTQYQYCQLAEFAKHMKLVYTQTYLQEYLNKPCIEYFVKLKMYRLLEDVLKQYSNALEDPHGKNPAQVFGVPKADVKTLVRLDVSGKELGLWRWCYKNGRQITEKDIRIIQSCDKDVHDFEFIRRYFELPLPPENLSLSQIPLTRFLKYLKKQMKGENSSLSHLGLDWLDYISACCSLKYDLTDESTLWPRNLEDAHDKTTALVKVQKSQKQDKAIRKQYLTYMKNYGYEGKDFLVTVPSCAADLIAEGQKMHHCVGTYLTRVAEGECVILFIRRTAEPNQPFVTAEIRQNRLVQIRAKNNANPSEAVKAFWNEYTRAKLTEKKETGGSKIKSENRKAG